MKASTNTNIKATAKNSNKDNAIALTSIAVILSPIVLIWWFFSAISMSPAELDARDAQLLKERDMRSSLEANRAMCQNTRDPGLCKNESEIKARYGN